MKYQRFAVPLQENLRDLFKEIDREYPKAKKKPTEKEMLEIVKRDSYQ